MKNIEVISMSPYFYIFTCLIIQFIIHHLFQLLLANLFLNLSLEGTETEVYQLPYSPLLLTSQFQHSGTTQVKLHSHTSSSRTQLLFTFLLESCMDRASQQWKNSPSPQLSRKFAERSRIEMQQQSCYRIYSAGLDF